jgi:hypothetical protein
MDSGESPESFPRWSAGHFLWRKESDQRKLPGANSNLPSEPWSGFFDKASVPCRKTTAFLAVALRVYISGELVDAEPLSGRIAPEQLDSNNISLIGESIITSQSFSPAVMRGRQTLDAVEGGFVFADIPQPCLPDTVFRVIQDPDQIVPIVVSRFRHPAHIASWLPAGSIGFHLVPRTVPCEIEAPANGRSAMHGSGILGLAHPQEHRSIVFRQRAGNCGSIFVKRLLSQHG